MQCSTARWTRKDTFLILELARATDSIAAHHQYFSIQHRLVKHRRDKTIFEATQTLHAIALQWLCGHNSNSGIVRFQATCIAGESATGAETSNEDIEVGQIVNNLKCR